MGAQEQYNYLIWQTPGKRKKKTCIEYQILVSSRPKLKNQYVQNNEIQAALSLNLECIVGLPIRDSSGRY